MPPAVSDPVAESDLPSLEPFIHGSHASIDGEPIDVFNPADGSVVGQTPDVGAEGVDRAVRSAREALPIWSRMIPKERAAALGKIGDALEERAEEFGRLEALDVGKPVQGAIAEMLSSADRIRFFGQIARAMQAPSAGTYRDTITSMISREPIGVVGVISPWNYPMGLLAWKVAPALAAGNTVVLKTAPETPLTSMLMAELAAEFLPDGTFNVISGNGATTGQALVTHPHVPMISMTGETETGKAIMRAAADRIKKLHLELGGNAPVIVFEDADLDRFEAQLHAAAFRNTGQDCHAASRVFVEESRHGDVLETVSQVARAQRTGDMFDPETVMGPLVSQAQRERVSGFVQGALNTGHVEATEGGYLPDGDGFFYPATILDGVRVDDDISQHEVFGPVIRITTFESESEVTTTANDSRYGLTASVWTQDIDRALRLARNLEVGTVWINEHGRTVTEMPYGGLKESGVGRELGMTVLEEHTEMKHVGIAVNPTP